MSDLQHQLFRWFELVNGVVLFGFIFVTEVVIHVFAIWHLYRSLFG